MDENTSGNEQDKDISPCALCGAEGYPTFFALRGTDRGAYSGRILAVGTILCGKDIVNFDMALAER